MDLVLDANILFASLIKDGATASLLFSDKFHLYAPEYLLDEFKEHETTILKKTGRTKTDFHEFLNLLKRRIVFIAKEEIQEYIEEANSISPDPDDVPYFALALLIKGAIWSNDEKLKKQKRIPVFSTKEIIESLKAT